MFEQHPVPQNISSYQFRLIGDMTIKQFFELAGGAVVGLLFYASPIPGLFKWPLILISVIFGAALAFLPIQDRPLEQWVLAFLRAIYSPTIFVWKKQTAPAQYFQGANVATAAAAQEETTISSSSPKPQFLESLEDAESNFLKNVTGMFAKAQAQDQQQAANPNEPFKPTITTPVAPVIQQPGSVPAPVAPLPDIQSPKGAILSSTPPGVPNPAGKLPQQHTGIQTSLNVPQQVKPEIDAKGWSPPANASGFVKQENQQTDPSLVSQPLPGQQLTDAQTAQFSQEAAPPAPPTQPNIVVGQIKDKDENIIEGVILEIVDEFGRPVRALKSNKAGHFSIVTPLTNGKYQIKAEKDDFKFDPISIDVKGEVLPPIQIQAK